MAEIGEFILDEDCQHLFIDTAMLSIVAVTTWIRNLCLLSEKERQLFIILLVK